MEVKQKEINDIKSSIAPKYKVLLHNDDHNSCDYVVLCLLKTVNTLSQGRAIEIMFEAHNNGIALIITVPFEIAEFYKECLCGHGLNCSIEAE